MKVIYVDNNATTKVAEEVTEEMLPYFSIDYGNPSSAHTFGGNVRNKVEEARGKVADLVGAHPTEIIFTSCGTESDNAGIRSILEISSDRKHFVTSRVEHPAVLNLVPYLTRCGHRVSQVPVSKEGLLDMEMLSDALEPHTAIVSIMYANNETGVIFPVEEIGEMAHYAGAYYHCDAVQAVGKIPINLKENNIDLLSISGHKLHAPKGIGALYVRKGIRFPPFIIGGHQESGRRGGTENVPYIIGLGKACELAKKNIEKENTHVKALRDRLEKNLLAIPETRINGHLEDRLPNTTNISFRYIEGEAILLHLSSIGICASSGSACTSGSLQPSHVLRAMGVPYDYAHGSIRFSLSPYNTQEEIDFIIEKMPGIVNRLRQISPYWKEAAAGKGSA